MCICTHPPHTFKYSTGASLRAADMYTYTISVIVGGVYIGGSGWCVDGGWCHTFLSRLSIRNSKNTLLEIAKTPMWGKMQLH